MKTLEGDPFQTLILLFLAGVASSVYFSFRKRLNALQNGNGHTRHLDHRVGKIEDNQKLLFEKLDFLKLKERARKRK